MTARLRARGFEKRAGAIFTYTVSNDVIGWLGVNTARRHLVAGSVEVFPVVGVRHQGIERIVAELRGEKFHPYLPPTVSSPLGQLMPDMRYKAWAIGPNDIDTKSDEVVAAIEKFGVPFMESGSSLREIDRLLNAGMGAQHQLIYRRPVSLLLLGDVARAMQVVDSSQEGLGTRDDPAATEFRSFADRFRVRYGLNSAD
ncbi:MAG: hypothetical protein ABIR17_10315 [Pseudolysinimonas sp.]|uniref:hypothetical protein n=1 Tax=Pseudolysinimonas sp. TaxID=2680009 RepID=UPI003265F2EA